MSKIFKASFIAGSFAIVCLLGSFTESNLFLKKLHASYLESMRKEQGKSFVSSMQKFDGACIAYNDPAFDDIKQKGTTYKFNPKNPTQAKFAVCISFIKAEKAKDVMKKVKRGLGTGTSSAVKSPLMVCRVDETVYTLSWSCDLKGTETEKMLINAMQEEMKAEKSVDYVLVNCGGTISTND